MIDLSAMQRTEHPQYCVVPAFDTTYLNVIFKDVHYKLHKYTDIKIGLAPLSYEEAINQMIDITESGAPTVPIIIEAPFEAKALRQTLKPLYMEPFDSDFIAWQKQFIVSQVYENPTPQAFHPVSVDKNLLSETVIDILFRYTEGA